MALPLSHNVPLQLLSTASKRCLWKVLICYSWACLALTTCLSFVALNHERTYSVLNPKYPVEAYRTLPHVISYAADAWIAAITPKGVRLNETHNAFAPVTGEATHASAPACPAPTKTAGMFVEWTGFEKESRESLENGKRDPMERGASRAACV
ncbi:hypothetical protein DL96DRAFT_1644666 [Flagelloscypha sp. PMI_526]|nr:hypothetical protein DL96DRAFT_1644666 [Flagelloscypha sp. PMI_526]